VTLVAITVRIANSRNGRVENSTRYSSGSLPT
jgi:hypothetical protein